MEKKGQPVEMESQPVEMESQPVDANLSIIKEITYAKPLIHELFEISPL